VKNAFRDALINALSDGKTLSINQVYDLFPNMHRNTVAWHLHEEYLKGTVDKAGHGIYKLSSSTPANKERLSCIQDLSRNAYECIKNNGYEFYLSGFDCMNGNLFQISGFYPVIVCTKRKNLKDVQLLLMREFDLAITEDEPDLLAVPALRKRIQFIVLASTDFSLQKDGFAFPEKAFADLYYACTRMEYPLHMRELIRILGIIKPNAYRFRKATKDRKVSNELNFLISYNKEFILSFSDSLRDKDIIKPGDIAPGLDYHPN